jgi:glycosyltransferase involved in cell wall biosynthesis
MFNKNKERIVCITPARNECIFLEKLIKKLNKYCTKIVIIDDGSTDDTLKILKKENVSLIINSKTIGKAASIVKAYQSLLHDDFDYNYVLLIDSDLQHDPDEIPKLLDELKNNNKDIVIGRRNLQSLEMPPIRRIWNKYISFIIKFLFKLDLVDSQSGFRLFTKKSFKQILALVKTNGYLLETEADLIMKNLNLSYSEVEIKTVYQKIKLKNDSIFFLILRMLRIFFYILYVFFSQIFLSYRLQMIYTVLLLVAINSLHSFYLAQKPIFNLASQTEYARKYVEATTWLRDSTPKDSIILTEWTEGHQVVLLANRKVVATTKVYPSEAKEIANRYTDLANFFYSNDVKKIKNVLNKHDVDYIFMRRKDFSYDSSCKGIFECDHNNEFLIALISGKLNKYPFIINVYKNSRILIYKYKK